MVHLFIELMPSTLSTQTLLMFRWFYDWLARMDSPCSADLIFVHAGLEIRKSFAVELYYRGLAPRILFSVGRYEIRRFVNLALPLRIDLLKMVEKVPHRLRHFLVSVAGQQLEVQRISAGRLGTMREIEALTQWLEKRPQIKSILIVSSNIHLRRVRMCCGTLLPAGLKIHLLAVPEEHPGSGRTNWLADSQTRKLVLTEVLKIICYLLILPFHGLAGAWRCEQPQTIIR